MPRTVAIGLQDFEKVISKNCFYVDKTNFIKEWWENDDDVTLIARPRRFGKTLNMSMLEAFFSNRHHQEELFKGLEIWKSENMRKIAGTYPVISLSFANVKETTYEAAFEKISEILIKLYSENSFLVDSDTLTVQERQFYHRVIYGMNETTASYAIHNMSDYLSRYYGKKVIILLDEYDTSMQEAYINGYWERLMSFIKSLFNATFKTNPYMERAVMTGITRVSKESVFSGLNNLEVVTATSEKYASSFGFTETEVFDAMEEQGLHDREKVKFWYDGFTFGSITDIYNPWSIINYLDKKTFATYWASTSSNGLVGMLLRKSGAKIKTLFERLLTGSFIDVPVDEQIVYHVLDTNEGAIWSLLLATGYLKVLEHQKVEQLTGNRKTIYRLMLTNEEVKTMFFNMVSDWFAGAESEYNDFIKALIAGDVRAMNAYMKIVCDSVFSYFDTGSGQEENTPERFYHGFAFQGKKVLIGE